MTKVGYQTKDLASGTYTMLSVPFYHVNNDGKGLMLNSDIKIEGVTPHGDDAELADQIWVWNPSDKAYAQFFYYAGIPGEYDPGWCDRNDVDWNYFEDRPGFENGLPEGSAIYYKAQVGTGKTLTGSGEVESEDEYEIPLASGTYTMFSNPYPVATQLNDATQVTMKGVTPHGDDAELADQIWVWNPSDKAYAQFFYYAGIPGEYDPGWCDRNDVDWNYIQDRPGFENGIPAGGAMYYKAQVGSGKAIIFSSPMTK